VKRYVYSRWDGSLEAFSLDARQALDALSDLLMEGLDANEALEWMRRHGFEMAGQDFRVKGTDELIAELREQARQLQQQWNLDHALDELAKRFGEVMQREQQAVEGEHGFESSRMNDFQQRRHADDTRLSDAIERFRDYEFEDEEAEEDYRELLDELDRMRALEDFIEQQGERFQGEQSADYETAQEIREQMQGLEQLARDLASGNFEQISPEQLQELLGNDAAQSLIILRDLDSSLRDAGYLRGQDPELTPRAIRKIGASALAEVYAALRKDRFGRMSGAPRCPGRTRRTPTSSATPWRSMWCAPFSAR
jgi:uncharacterized protein with von Willebrand factor type A (vWA) domain